MKISLLVTALLNVLKVRSTIGGIEISDSVLRFALFNGKDWKLAGLRLPPGIIVGGEVKDRAQFVAALSALRREIFGSKDFRRRKIDVVVSLSSVNIYCQVFSLPMVEGENLEKAVHLNIQMVSPAESSETYAGWQLVGKDQKTLRLEILSAFIDRKIVDVITRALGEAGFVIHSIESRALSLTRLLREASEGFDPEKPYLVLALDSSGLELLVIRKGNLHFQYFNSWRDIQGEDRTISRELFRAAIVRNVNQVLNFYKSHWAEPVSAMFVSAGSLKEEIAEIVRSNFPLKILEVRLRIKQAVSPDWFVALGSGLRSLVSHRKDEDISLLGLSAQEEFRRHQLLQFFEFWRLAIPLALSFLFAAFLASEIFLSRMSTSLASRVEFAASSGQAKEIASLQTRVQEFNRLTTLIRVAEQTTSDKILLLARVGDLLTPHGTTLQQLYFQGETAPILLKGWAESREQIFTFKKTLDEHPEFQGVSLPFAEIKPGAHGLSFSVNFTIVPEKTE